MNRLPLSLRLFDASLFALCGLNYVLYLFDVTMTAWTVIMGAACLVAGIFILRAFLFDLNWFPYAVKGEFEEAGETEDAPPFVLHPTPPVDLTPHEVRARAGAADTFNREVSFPDTLTL